MKESAQEHQIRVPRSARYYTLGSARAPEVWIVCHGYGQLAGRFIRNFASIAGEHRFIVAPEALQRFYLDPPDRPAAQRRVGATWMTREDRETDIRDYVEYLDRIYDIVVADRVLPVTALGFSQGVATAARWAVLTERPLRRLIGWGSLLPPDLDWRRAQERLRGLSVQFVLGDQDPATPLEQVQEQERTANRWALEFDYIHFAGGHVIDAATLQQIA